MRHLTDDMTRLVGEIQTGRADRARTLHDVQQATTQMKREVAQLQAGFSAARADMAHSQQRLLRGFVADLRGTVAGLRKACAADLQGARQAWMGSATAAKSGGTSRRSGKWFGGAGGANA